MAKLTCGQRRRGLEESWTTPAPRSGRHPPVTKRRLLAATLAATLLTALLQIIGLAPAGATPPGVPTAATARTELATLTVAAWTHTTTYERDLFPTWDTISGTCDTRETVLKRDGTSVARSSTSGSSP